MVLFYYFFTIPQPNYYKKMTGTDGLSSMKLNLKLGGFKQQDKIWKDNRNRQHEISAENT